MAQSLNSLTHEYVEWNASQGLQLGSADEHLFDEGLTHAQRDWLRDFCGRWEAVEEARHDPIVSTERLWIDDDYGTSVLIRTIYADTLLGIRRAVRELNPGSIPIYSDYDCTGLVCAQTCKMLKIYKVGRGYTTVVEITVTRDV